MKTIENSKTRETITCAVRASNYDEQKACATVLPKAGLAVTTELLTNGWAAWVPGGLALTKDGFAMGCKMLA